MPTGPGGVIEPLGHTKMLHDFDAGPASMCDMPFLAVNRKGERFVNETVAMSLLNNYLRDAENAVTIHRFSMQTI